VSCSLGLESLAPCLVWNAQHAPMSYELIMKGVQPGELLLGA